MHTGVLWREEVTHVHKGEYPDVKLVHILADNAAMQLVRNPLQFDVIVTDNLFGDILSDEASMLTSSLGMPFRLARREGREDRQGEGALRADPRQRADIAGKNLANPIAAILSLAMCLRYSLERRRTRS